jgi:hypothetical protein
MSTITPPLSGVNTYNTSNLTNPSSATDGMPQMMEQELLARYAQSSSPVEQGQILAQLDKLSLGTTPTNTGKTILSNASSQSAEPPTQPNGRPGNGPGEITTQEMAIQNFMHNEITIQNDNPDLGLTTGEDNRGNHYQFRDRDGDGYADIVYKMTGSGTVFRTENMLFWQRTSIRDMIGLLHVRGNEIGV